MSERWHKISRRDVLAWGFVGGLAGASGLLLGYRVGERRERWRKRAPRDPARFRPSVFLGLEPDGTVVVWLTKAELGQGVMTSLPMIVADELDADWNRVRVEQALANLNYGDMSTVTSSSVRSLWEPLREAGATARAMLVAAAAAEWGVAVDTCTTERGMVVHADGRRTAYAGLVRAASRLPVPERGRLVYKSASEQRLIGRSLPRLDVPAKLTGTATFGLDVRVPGQVFAVTARASALGGEIRLVDATAARAVPGVIDVITTPFGVAVVADTTWAAMKGRDALELEHTPATAFDDASVGTALRERVDGPVAVALDVGSNDEVDDLSPVVEYQLPFLAHTPMETINCTARVESGRCEVWAATQDPLSAQSEAMDVTGLEAAAVIVHTTFVGGGFGRRVFHPEVREAVWLSARLERPVQSVWSRDDDVRHDFYRPAALHRLRGRLDASGLRWHHRVISPSILQVDSADGLDELAVDGAAQLPYAVSAARVEWTSAQTPVPLGFWRSVGHSHTAFAVESFIDELIVGSGGDPIAGRLQLLADKPRHRAVLERVAVASGWSEAAAEGRHRGVAVHASFGSVVAQVVEVSVHDDKRVTVHRVVCAVDCGRIVHPDGVVAQIEGGIVFGLTAALQGRITFAEGEVRSSNFDDQPLLRMPQVPAINVELLDGGEVPGGVGEIAVPVIAPALANALAAATGERWRSLPLLDPGGRLRS